KEGTDEDDIDDEVGFADQLDFVLGHVREKGAAGDRSVDRKVSREAQEKWGLMRRMGPANKPGGRSRPGVGAGGGGRRRCGRGGGDAGGAGALEAAAQEELFVFAVEVEGLENALAEAGDFATGVGGE